jgi:hypothetical protein
MPSARGGDTSATYPPAMRVAGLPGADTRSLNEVFGFFFRLSTQSAAWMTDYVVDAGTVAMIGGGNTDQLVKFACRVGLLSKVRVDGMTAYKLIDDPEFIHIRLASEVEWERQQRADTSDLRLSVPVRARDGDLCRYCQVPCVWAGRTSSRKGTLDHLNPGEPATVTTLVVACKGCNSELRDVSGLERETLKPPPDPPFYTPRTAEWLTKNGRPTLPTEAGDPPRPGTQPDDAPSTKLAPTSVQRPGSQPDTAHAVDSDPAPGSRATATGKNARSKSPPPAFPVTAGMSSVGSGRAGSGNARSSNSPSPDAARRRKRSPRGRPATQGRTDG